MYTHTYIVHSYIVTDAVCHRRRGIINTSGIGYFSVGREFCLTTVVAAGAVGCVNRRDYTVVMIALCFPTRATLAVAVLCLSPRLSRPPRPLYLCYLSEAARLFSGGDRVAQVRCRRRRRLRRFRSPVLLLSFSEPGVLSVAPLKKPKYLSPGRFPPVNCPGVKPEGPNKTESFFSPYQFPPLGILAFPLFAKLPLEQSFPRHSHLRSVEEPWLLNRSPFCVAITTGRFRSNR